MSSILEEGYINIIINALRQGITNLNDLTNKVFFAKNPKLDPKMPLKQEQTTEVRQWVAISAEIKNLIQLIKVDPHFPVPLQAHEDTMLILLILLWTLFVKVTE